MRKPSTDLPPPRLLIIVLAGLAMLASCGNDDSTEPAATNPSSSSVLDTDGSAGESDTTDAEADAADIEAAESDSEEAGDDSESDYPPFVDIDPASSPFFSALEGTDLVERIGEQEIYERGLTICRDFDNGTTVDGEIDRLLGAGFGADTPLLMAAAVTEICPQHVDSTTG
jgi:hypothetical protein